MCDQQRLRPACTYAQSDQSLCWTLEYSMIVKLLREHHLEFLRLKGASSKIFYWPFQGGTSFVDILCFWSVLFLLCLCARLFICALWSPAGKGLTSWLSFVVSAVSLSLSHWYPGSSVVLDCIDSWSLHPYLLCTGSSESIPVKMPHWWKSRVTAHISVECLHSGRNMNIGVVFTVAIRQH